MNLLKCLFPIMMMMMESTMWYVYMTNNGELSTVLHG